MIGKFLLLTTLALVQGKAVERTGGFVASDRCLAAGHQLLPHEYDCTKFYSCDNGRKWETPRVCSPGTEFSYELQICVHPNLANCNLLGAPPADAEEPTGALTLTPPNRAVQVLDWPQSTVQSNSGYRNLGTGNIGTNNMGNYNTGSNNIGNNNEGNSNIGNFNFGNYNRGNRNSGNYNTGNNNRGNNNQGNNNIGNNNIGNDLIGNNLHGRANMEVHA